jgi:hypothetical protein
MTTYDLENLVATLSQYIRKAQNNGDSFEYFRLGEELKMVNAALNSVRSQSKHTSLLQASAI